MKNLVLRHSLRNVVRKQVEHNLLPSLRSLCRSELLPPRLGRNHNAPARARKIHGNNTDNQAKRRDDFKKDQSLDGNAAYRAQFVVALQCPL